jgi:hypothetical protein
VIRNCEVGKVIADLNLRDHPAPLTR